MLAVLPMVFGTASAGEPMAGSWRGLRVAHEVVESVEGVNGMPLRIERFTGRDVPELLQRWLEDWRSDARTAGQVSERSGGWKVHARLVAAGLQEVMQVRGSGDQAELLWSRMPLRPGSPIPARPARSRTGCRPGPAVQHRDALGELELNVDVCGDTARIRIRRLAPWVRR
jgi:hypothetical protein